MIDPNEVERLIRLSVKDNELLSFEELNGWVEQGKVAALPGKKSVIVYEIVDYESTGERAIQVIAAGGDLEELRNDIRPALEEWALQQGCSHVLIEGRAGWVRALKAHGYREISRTVSKRLI